MGTRFDSFTLYSRSLAFNRQRTRLLTGEVRVQLPQDLCYSVMVEVRTEANVGDLIRVHYQCIWISQDKNDPVVVPIVGIFAGCREYGAPGGSFYTVVQLLVEHRIAELQHHSIKNIELLSSMPS